jgi:phospholipase C
MAAEMYTEIEHIVVVTMENRSFDHFLGWAPGTDGKQEGLTFSDNAGAAYATYPLAPDFRGRGHPNPDHSYLPSRVAFNDGKCDGWLKAGDNDRFAIGYYRAEDLGFFGQAAPQWTVCDRYFAAIMSETIPNRIYQLAAQTDRITDTRELCTLPTIFDRLGNNPDDVLYYYSDVPLLALWGTRYLGISRPFNSFLHACARNQLPKVAFVDPLFVGEGLGITNDDHPYADIRNGEVFLAAVYRAVTQSKAWPGTVLVINFDEWGGFFDHVAPSIAEPVPAGDQKAGSDGRRGFRVPCLVIAPWSPRGHVNHTVMDHTSVLKMIEERWALQPLSERDANANSLAAVLDFAHPDNTAPKVPDVHFERPGLLSEAVSAVVRTVAHLADHTVLPAEAEVASEYPALLAHARKTGWPV